MRFHWEHERYAHDQKVDHRVRSFLFSASYSRGELPLGPMSRTRSLPQWEAAARPYCGNTIHGVLTPEFAQNRGFPMGADTSHRRGTNDMASPSVLSYHLPVLTRISSIKYSIVSHVIPIHTIFTFHLFRSPD